MTRDVVRYEYFEWLYELVTHNRYESIGYRKLLSYLHDTEFIFSIPKDINRAKDGLGLRDRFALIQGDRALANYLEGPCSIFEMILALAIRCEEEFMDDPDIGDRTTQWFWGMINNLGLGSSVDSNFNIYYVDDVVTRFLNREYEPNGDGGLFTVRHFKVDMRNLEIWHQLNYYIDEIM